MPDLDTILLVVVSLAAVALIAWILAACVESGLRHHREERDEGLIDSAEDAEAES